MALESIMTLVFVVEGCVLAVVLPAVVLYGMRVRRAVRLAVHVFLTALVAVLFLRLWGGENVMVVLVFAVFFLVVIPMQITSHYL